MELETIDQNLKPTQRPTFLTVLCILSFVWIGISTIGGLATTLGGPASEEEMLQAKVDLVKSADEMRTLGMDGFAEMFEKIQRMAESTNANFYAVSIISIIVLLTGLYGVILMWKGRKLGFHLYIVYNLLTIIQLYFFVSPADIPSFVVIWNSILSGIFVLMYSRNLKWLS